MSFTLIVEFTGVVAIVRRRPEGDQAEYYRAVMAHSHRHCPALDGKPLHAHDPFVLVKKGIPTNPILKDRPLPLHYESLIFSRLDDQDALHADLDILGKLPAALAEIPGKEPAKALKTDPAVFNPIQDKHISVACDITLGKLTCTVAKTPKGWEIPFSNIKGQDRKAGCLAQGVEWRVKVTSPTLTLHTVDFPKVRSALGTPRLAEEIRPDGGEVRLLVASHSDLFRQMHVTGGHGSATDEDWRWFYQFLDSDSRDAVTSRLGKNGLPIPKQSGSCPPKSNGFARTMGGGQDCKPGGPPDYP